MYRTKTTKNLILSALFASLIATGAFLKIPVPMMPFTLQFLFTNLAGLLLGKRYGAIATGVYLALGLIGLPIFTSGGGIGYIFQPTFGYLLGFVLGTFIAGFVVEKRKICNLKTLLIGSFANLIVVYIIGMIYYFFIANYYLNSPIGIGYLFLYCFILAVPGDIVLCIVSALLCKRLYPILKKGNL